MKQKTGGSQRPSPKGRKGLVSPPASCAFHKALKGKRLFLDLRGFKGLSVFENELKILGALIEKCFSKDVNCVITNKGQPKDYERPKDKGISQSVSSPTTPSPFNLANLDSPTAGSPNQIEAVKKPITRGQALAQAAKGNKGYGSTDVVENARRWNIRVAHIQAAQKWVKKELEKLPATLRAGTVSQTKNKKPNSKVAVKRLKGNVIKFEAINRHYRPVRQEFEEFPKIYFNSPFGSCPFEKGRESRGINEDELDRAEGDLEEREERDEEGVRGDNITSQTASKSRDRRPAKENRNTSEASCKVYTAGDINRFQKEKSRLEQKKGFCEMCYVKYDNIDKHVRTEQHKKYVRNASNYKKLDQLIEKGPNITQFLDDVVKYQALHLHQALQESEDTVLLIPEFSSPHRPRRKHIRKSPRSALKKVLKDTQTGSSVNRTPEPAQSARRSMRFSPPQNSKPARVTAGAEDKKLDKNPSKAFVLIKNLQNTDKLASKTNSKVVQNIEGVKCTTKNDKSKPDSTIRGQPASPVLETMHDGSDSHVSTSVSSEIPIVSSQNFSENYPGSPILDDRMAGTRAAIRDRALESPKISENLIRAGWIDGSAFTTPTKGSQDMEIDSPDNEVKIGSLKMSAKVPHFNKLAGQDNFSPRRSPRVINKETQSPPASGTKGSTNATERRSPRIVIRRLLELGSPKSGTNKSCPTHGEELTSKQAKAKRSLILSNMSVSVPVMEEKTTCSSSSHTKENIKPYEYSVQKQYGAGLDSPTKPLRSSPRKHVSTPNTSKISGNAKLATISAKTKPGKEGSDTGSVNVCIEQDLSQGSTTSVNSEGSKKMDATPSRKPRRNELAQLLDIYPYPKNNSQNSRCTGSDQPVSVSSSHASSPAKSRESPRKENGLQPKLIPSKAPDKQIQAGNTKESHQRANNYSASKSSKKGALHGSPRKQVKSTKDKGLMDTCLNPTKTKTEKTINLSKGEINKSSFNEKEKQRENIYGGISNVSPDNSNVCNDLQPCVRRSPRKPKPVSNTRHQVAPVVSNNILDIPICQAPVESWAVIDNDNRDNAGKSSTCKNLNNSHERKDDSNMHQNHITDSHKSTCSTTQSHKRSKSRKKRKIKLKHNWSVLSDRSMLKLLSSERDEDPFEGFSQDPPVQDIPTDLTYVDVSEVEVDDDEDVEWVFNSDTDEQDVSIQPGRSLDPHQAFPMLVGNLDDRADLSSEWDANMDQFVEVVCQKRISETPSVSGFSVASIKDDEISINSLTPDIPRKIKSRPTSKRQKSTPKVEKSEMEVKHGSNTNILVSPGKLHSTVKSPTRIASPRACKMRQNLAPTGTERILQSTPKLGKFGSVTLDYLSMPLDDIEPLWVGPPKSSNPVVSPGILSPPLSIRSGSTTRVPIYKRTEASKKTGLNSSPCTPELSHSKLVHSTPIETGDEHATKTSVIASPTRSQSTIGFPTKRLGSPRACKIRPNLTPTGAERIFQVDNEVQFNYGNHGNQQKCKTNKSDHTNPSDNQKTGRERIVPKMLVASFGKEGSSESVTENELDGVTPPKNRLLKHAASNKKSYNLTHIPAFQQKGSNSIRVGKTQLVLQTMPVTASDLEETSTRRASGSCKMSSPRASGSSKRGRSMPSVAINNSPIPSKIRNNTSSQTENLSPNLTVSVKRGHSTSVAKEVEHTPRKARESPSSSLVSPTSPTTRAMVRAGHGRMSESVSSTGKCVSPSGTKTTPDVDWNFPSSPPKGQLSKRPRTSPSKTSRIKSPNTFLKKLRQVHGSTGVAGRLHKKSKKLADFYSPSSKKRKHSNPRRSISPKRLRTRSPVKAASPLRRQGSLRTHCAPGSYAEHSESDEDDLL